MGTTLTGTTPQDTYDSLIKVTDNGPLSGTAKYLSDGLGNDSVLAVSTSKVGVGTTTPQGKLSVSSGAAGGGYNSDYDELVLTNAGRVGINILSSAAEYSAIIMGGAADNVTGGIYHKADTKMLSFATNDTFRVNIDSAGNVGIGTSTPEALLDLYSASGVQLRLANATTGTDATDGTRIYLSGSDLFIVNRENAPIKFFTSDTERFAITNNGVTFNGDTAAANALDDYEEGIWTPTISFGGASVDLTYAASRAGQYTKIGRQVTATAYILLTNKGTSTGAASIGGLPYVIGGSSGFYSSASFSAISQLSYVGMLQGYGEINTNRIDLVETTEAGSQTNITDADFTNVSQVLVQFTYFV
jgi:hypothetical protein